MENRRMNEDEALKKFLEGQARQGIIYPEPVRISIDRSWRIEFTLWSDGKESSDRFDWRRFTCPEGWFRDRRGRYFNRKYYEEERDAIGMPMAVRRKKKNESFTRTV